VQAVTALEKADGLSSNLKERFLEITSSENKLRDVDTEGRIFQWMLGIM
jgi:hypothetical protein